MQLEPPFDEVTPHIIYLYEQKIRLHKKVIATSKVMLAGPKANEDYSSMVAEMPEIRAFLDDTEHSLFKVTQMVFLLLIDKRPDSKNQLNHLVITNAERTKLINDIDVDFGAKLEQKNSNYTVSSAALLKAMLLKDYKCADDPWQ
jgi:hypothetical protein